MKDLLRKIFSPILKSFESGDGEYGYKKSHRKILVVMGSLFMVLSVASGISAVTASEVTGLIPVLVFFIVGLVCVVIGSLGTDRAVAKIWGN